MRLFSVRIDSRHGAARATGVRALPVEKLALIPKLLVTARMPTPCLNLIGIAERPRVCASDAFVDASNRRHVQPNSRGRLPRPSGEARRHDEDRNDVWCVMHSILRVYRYSQLPDCVTLLIVCDVPVREPEPDTDTVHSRHVPVQVPERHSN